MRTFLSFLMVWFVATTGISCWAAPTLPPTTDFDVSAVSWTTYEGAHVGLINLLATVPGMVAPTTKTIASGSITPTTGATKVAAESGTADDLDTIVVTNFSTGYLEIYADTGDTITVTEVGNIYLLSGSELELTNNDRLTLMRWGAGWIETGRNIATLATLSPDGTISTPANMDVGGTMQAGSGNVTITNATGNVLGSTIATGTVTATQIATGTITATQMASDAHGYQLFSASGTWVAPVGVTQVKLTGIGGGGGGGGGAEISAASSGNNGSATTFIGGVISITFGGGSGGGGGGTALDKDIGGKANGAGASHGMPYVTNFGTQHFTYGGTGGSSIFGSYGCGGTGGNGYDAGAGAGGSCACNQSVCTVVPATEYTITIGGGGDGGDTDGFGGNATAGADGNGGALLIEW